MSLLPKSHSQFHEKSYWDSFFLDRDRKAFEWYGEFVDIESILLPKIKASDKILVIGCGNSNMSSCLYDKGFQHITNLDFSDIVINEMRAKNIARVNMVWSIGDMTNMPQYSDGEFDVVIDKGALDALLSDASEHCLQQASSMFREISRVLTQTGKYICITLAQDFVLRAHTHYFAQASTAPISWNLSVEGLECSTPSPFVPFFTVASKQPGSETSRIQLYIDNIGTKLASPKLVGVSTLHDSLQKIQEFHQKQFDLGEIRLGRFETIEFWSPDQSLPFANSVPRFSITILDSPAAASRTCAVFFVPTGHESDYRYNSQSGLQAVSESASCRRLIAVRCNRPHTFPIMSELQAELSPIAMSLKPRVLDAATESIPFLAIQEESEWDTIHQGETPLSGRFIVEEAPVEKNPDAIQRRLIFLQNQNFIQTEARLILCTARKPKPAASGSKGKAKGGKGKSGIKSTSAVATLLDEEIAESDLLDFDLTHLDDHHKAVVCAFCLVPDLIARGTASLQAAKKGAKIIKPSISSSPLSGLVVGLGGGSIAMCLQRYLPNSRLDIVELDPGMEAIAKEFFGFKKGPKTNVIVADGVDYIAATSTAASISNVDLSQTQEASEAPESSSTSLTYDFIFIDVDSKDPSLALSAPPASFITSAALQATLQLLSPAGILAFNVVARGGPVLITQLVDSIRASGSRDTSVSSPSSSYSSYRYFTIDASDDSVNVIVVVVKEIIPAQAMVSAAAPAKKQAAKSPALPLESRTRIQRENLLESWLQSIGFAADPLRLVDIVPQIKALT